MKGRLRSAAACLWAALAACTATPSSAPPEAAAADLVFVGNASVGSGRLRGVIAEDVGSLSERGYRRSAIDDAAFAVEQFYASQGWPFCRVDYELEQPAPSEGPRARLVIEEGPRTLLESVTLRGNRSFTEDELLEFVRMPSQDGRRFFHRRGFDDGARAIATWYFSQGFLGVEVSEPEVRFNESSTRAAVEITIDEGRRSMLRAIVLEGAPEGTEPGFDDWTGEVFTPPLIASVRRRVRESLGHHGYPDASVQVREERAEDAGVTLRVTVEPGPRVIIGAVRVVGNEKTRTRRIERSLALGPGQRYDVERLRESFSELYETGLFNSVRLSLDGDGEQRTLVVEVDEVPSTELYVEPGYGSYERGRLGVGWRERNLFGTGRILDVEGRLSQFARRAEIDLTDPHLFESEVSANLSVFYDWRQEPSFTDEEVGTGITLTRRLAENLQGSLGYQFRRTDVIDVEVVGPEVTQALADVDVSSVLAGLVHDTRDRLFAPRRGTLTRPTLELASAGLGSEVDFVRVNLRHSRFHALGEGTVLGLSFKGGMIVPIGGTDTIPLQERYFNGGENTVRSFREDELGPLDVGGEPTGGEAYTVLTAEVRQHLAGALEGAVFFDSGNLQTDYAKVLSFDDMRHAVGAGLRYMLPIGPLRVDVGFNPNRRPGEDRFVVHFSVGMAF